MCRHIGTLDDAGQRQDVPFVASLQHLAHGFDMGCGDFWNTGDELRRARGQPQIKGTTFSAGLIHIQGWRRRDEIGHRCLGVQGQPLRAGAVHLPFDRCPARGAGSKGRRARILPVAAPGFHHRCQNAGAGFTGKTVAA